MTREADCGRGPVDFKFTQGWTMRGLIEVKHIENKSVHPWRNGPIANLSEG
jgi:hypothetical protein